MNRSSLQTLALSSLLIVFFGCTIIPPSPLKSCCDGGGLTITNADGSGFWLPSAFTPNNDGLNDDLRLIGNGVSRFTLKVYSGKTVVFTSSSFSKQWDGKINGNPVDAATYRVVVEGQFTHNGPFSGDTEVCLVYNCWKQNMKGCVTGDQFSDSGFIEGSTSQDPAIQSCI